MKKTYKIEVDCANCANLMEDAARKTAGVQTAPSKRVTAVLRGLFRRRQINS